MGPDSTAVIIAFLFKVKNVAATAMDVFSVGWVNMIGHHIQIIAFIRFRVTLVPLYVKITNNNFSEN